MEEFIIYLHIDYFGIVKILKHEIMVENLEEAKVVGKELKKMFKAFRFNITEEKTLFDSLP